MPDVFLHGADNVIIGGRMIRDAANDMQRAADNIDNSLRRHEIFLENWLAQFSECIDKLTAVTIEGKEEAAKHE